MELHIFDSKQELGRAAACRAAELIREAIQRNGAANIILATGASQFEVLAGLVAAEGIAWDRVTAFHLDEYIHLPESHPASFRRYLKERFVERLPGRLAAFHPIQGEADPETECQRLAALIARQPMDLALIGIGENGHLAFNDPPADFQTQQPYLVVELDETCRRQQFGEGWFPTMDAVPGRAISMSIRQLMKSAHLICSVPDLRKAGAVRAAIEGPVTPQVPASILQEHPAVAVFLDRESASLLAAQPGSSVA
jgi:glucosamine-6-phosphate deaminase